MMVQAWGIDGILGDAGRPGSRLRESDSNS